ncbi:MULTISPECIES: MoaF C-terminal domain-containing protein [Brucella]|uniref:MoaF C-terminal domain-containing protein n=1 Tax=Brucella inopinata TaxID=1218315 RepID=UPI0005C7C79D
MDTNRLPASDALAGTKYAIRFDDGRELSLEFSKDKVSWKDASGSGTDAVEVVEVAPDTYFVEIIFAAKPLEAETLILNLSSRRALSILSVVRAKEETVGEPQVGQIFLPGVIAGGEPSGMVPEETRDLIGLRAHFTYSPNHVYEHTYLSSKRYAWQCLVGVQRGHGDVDLATTYKFAEGQYVFTFREFKIPVASTFFYNFADMRSTGKFLGINGQGAIQNSPAGAFIRKASVTFYHPGQEPV